jgi:hypothetical protein
MTQQVNTFSGQVRDNNPARGYPWVDTDAPRAETAVRTIDAIMADVGTDPELAQAAYDEEKARPVPPRVTLLARLQAIIDEAES